MSYGRGFGPPGAEGRQQRALELKLGRILFRGTVLELGPPPWPGFELPALLRDSNPTLTPERALELAGILEREYAELVRARAVYAAAVRDLGPPPWAGSVVDLLLDNMPELKTIERARELAGELEADLSAAERKAILEARVRNRTLEGPSS